VSINNPQINSFRSSFLLDTVSARQANADWIDIAGKAGTYGWWTGGAPGTYTNIDRLDFANDTAAVSARANLTSGMFLHAAMNNANYGWHLAGNNPGNTSYVFRIDYGNDSTAPTLRGLLVRGRSIPAAISTDSYGWVAGGVGPQVSSVDRIDLSNDSPATSVDRGPLSAARGYLSAVGNANYAWFNGGNTVSSIIDRIDYANDSPTSASPRGPLNSTNSASSGASGNTNYGWFSGGQPTINSIVTRIDYSNDTSIVSTRGPISIAKYQQTAAGNANYGWHGGGTNNSVDFSGIDRIDYSNDSPTAATQRSSMTLVRRALAASSNSSVNRPLIVPQSLSSINPAGVVAMVSANYSWWAGGNVPGVVTTIDRIDFSNDSANAIARGSLVANHGQALTGTSNYNYGWFIGGAPTRSTMSRIDFANDGQTTVARGFLLVGRQNVAGAGNANYGWAAGGATPTYVSSVERIDYSNDTNKMTTRGPLSLARQGLVGNSNFNYGWFGGGYVPGNVSTVDRIDFSNDSPTSASPRGPLVIAARSISAAGNQNYGWWMGGTGPSPTSTVVNRLDYSSDYVVASARGFLSVTRGGGSASGNSSYGWNGSGNSSTIDRIDYSNDSPTVGTARGILTQARSDTASISNYVKSRFFPNLGGSENTNGTYGWVIGGSVNPPATTSAISRIDFNNDTVTASARGPLPATAYGVRGVNNDNYGWGGGGSIGSGSNIYRIDFSNDSPTGASQRSYLPYGVHSTGSASNINYGWWAGGNGPAILSAVNRLDFSNDLTNTSLRGPLSSSRYLLTGVSTNDYGWFAGGSLPPFSTAGNSLTSIDRIDFANDSPSTSSRRGNLTVARAGLAASGNSNYGWFGGGQTLQGTNLSSIEKIDYSNDSPTAASTRGPLSSARYLLAAVGNNSYGWWAGGAISSGPVSYSTVDRLDYSNDSPTAASPRGLLNKEVWFLGSTSNYTKKFAARITNTGTTLALNINLGIPQYAKTVNPVGTGVGTYGWTSGGAPGPLSSVERVDYSNDSPTSASTRGPLSAAVSSIAGTGNANYGWHGGNSPTNGSIDRIDYANDSPTSASPRGQLAFQSPLSAATGNANYGWWGGGSSGGAAITAVQRIDFSNDSPTTASLRGNLTTARNFLAATGNANYSWFGGGYNSALGNPNGRYSLVERVDFSNDNLTASVRSPLAAARYRISATGNANYGWFVAMVLTSNLERIDFSNDSPTSASPRGILSVQRVAAAATMSNANYGWFAGGQVSALPTSIIDRIDFSNDSPTSASPRGGLTTARANHAASSNYVK